MQLRGFIRPLLVWQGIVHVAQVAERHNKYDAARRYADSLGKPLVVVGGPLGANPFRRILRIPAHGCGDICVDIEREACEGCKRFIKADVRDIPLPDKYAGASYVSHVLEHLPTVADARIALRELERISDRVFICSPSKQSILAWLIPDHYLWVTQNPDGSVLLEERGR